MAIVGTAAAPAQPIGACGAVSWRERGPDQRQLALVDAATCGFGARGEERPQRGRGGHHRRRTTRRLGHPQSSAAIAHDRQRPIGHQRRGNAIKAGLLGPSTRRCAWSSAPDDSDALADGRGRSRIRSLSAPCATCANPPLLLQPRQGVRHVRVRLRRRPTTAACTTTRAFPTMRSRCSSTAAPTTARRSRAIGLTKAAHIYFRAAAVYQHSGFQLR